MKVRDDVLLKALDRSNVVFLVLLDLPAAFDTINHDILLDRMRDDLGVSDTALLRFKHWFKSYLSGRQSRVPIYNLYSGPVDLEYGLPQGSMLGPLMFGIYTLHIIRHHNIDFHLYADDTQLWCLASCH